MGFTKLFSDIVCSSIWNEDDKTRLVWVTLLAIKGPNHVARCTIGGLAHQARVSVDDCQKAVEKLLSPDPDGMDQLEQGRRIRAVEHGWLVINGESYRLRRDNEDRKEYQRVYHREYRRKQSVNKRKHSSTELNIVNPSDQIRSDENNKNGAVPPQQSLVLEELLTELKPVYPYIDLEVEKSKIRGWFIANPGKRKLTRRFVINWLNRVDKPLIDIKPKAKTVL